MTDLKTVKVRGELFYNQWMGKFNPMFNPANDKYECTLCNISDDDAAKLTSLGIKVKNKPNKAAMGNFIVGKSNYAFKPVDDVTMEDIDIKTLGNGSKCIAIVGSYTHRMSAANGNAPSIKKLMITEVKTYVPEEETDDAY